MKKELKIPKFKNEDEEFEFWSKIDLNEYYEPEDFVPVTFPNLKPSTTSISIRLPNHLLSRIKEKANAQDVPYQSLIKMYLSDRLRDEYRSDYEVSKKGVSGKKNKN
ncbi:MAG TPA: BrnA antitoxin family protein [bacterium]|nr:BrnA antitoxin family protein [bacterium]